MVATQHLGCGAHGGAFVHQPPAKGDLVRGERGWPSEPHAALLGRLAPRAGATQDQRPFELGGMRCTAYGRLCGVVLPVRINLRRSPLSPPSIGR